MQVFYNYVVKWKRNKPYLMKEDELVNKLKSGNEESYKILIETYQKMALNCTYKFVRNKETAEDITQEVFVEVFESIKTFRGDSKLSTWIYRITVTKSINYLNKMKTKKRFAFLTSLFGNEDEEINVVSSEPEPDKLLENKDRARILTWAVGKLPENQRIAFTLSKYQDMSYEEIALVLNTSISSVESLIHRAKTNLRKRLLGFYKKHL